MQDDDGRNDEVDNSPPLLQPAAQWFAGEDLPEKTLALTFDDGPGAHTLRIAEFLSRRGVSANFFVLGQQAVGKEWLLDELTRLGHTVGNHSYFTNPATGLHWWLMDKGAPDPVSNVADCDKLIAARVTDDTFLFRAPFFAYDDRLGALLNADARTKRYVGAIRARIGNQSNISDDTPDAGYMADWQCWDGLHSSAPPVLPHPFTPEQCGEIYLREIAQVGNPHCGGLPCDHGVVLMHDRNPDWQFTHNGQENDFTARMVEYLVPRLQEQGYRFVTLAEVPSIAHVVVTSGSPNLRPTDWDRVKRGHHVHWHKLRVANQALAWPGVESHDFVRDGATGRLSWDGTDLGGCAKEIGAVTTPNKHIVLVALGCDGVLRRQAFDSGQTPTTRFNEDADTQGATALVGLELDGLASVVAQLELDGGVVSHSVKASPEH